MRIKNIHNKKKHNLLGKNINTNDRVRQLFQEKRLRVEKNYIHQSMKAMVLSDG
jgi:hypothetical protein